MLDIKVDRNEERISILVDYDGEKEDIIEEMWSGIIAVLEDMTSNKREFAECMLVLREMLSDEQIAVAAKKIEDSDTVIAKGEITGVIWDNDRFPKVGGKHEKKKS